jgi:hypothetical protein
MDTQECGGFYKRYDIVLHAGLNFHYLALSWMPRSSPCLWMTFRFIFSYTSSMFNLRGASFCDFAVRCKGCGESIPARVLTMPDTG